MKKNNKGFTLAELLIVVAIIAVLTAIAIPVFTTQLEKSREATDASNIRAAYAEISVALLDGSLAKADDSLTISGGYTAKLSGAVSSDFTVTVENFRIKQTDYDSWVGGNPEIAGVTVSTVPKAATSPVIFTFKVPGAGTGGTAGKGSAYLQSITFVATA